MDEPLNATDLAGLLNVCRGHLTRTFRQQIGMPPHEYITRRKILSACQLLKESGLSTKAVAEAHGFDIPAHFTRTFKRIVGLTPTQFREVGSIPVL
jgi:AraC family transcriptional regulator